MKGVRENLYVRFAVELIVGIIVFLSILLFGEKGGFSLALMVLLTFFGKKKLDEREYQLFYKVDHYTISFVILAMVIIFFLLPSINWLLALVSVFLFFQGLCGLVIFARG